ncbi:Galactose mutarotase [Micromonospora rhizosphaerae]|uniref:Galactose mutarotase n=1 Tax=Micromonospora rhizosphaerae TaxID=568872 RepID=A0A1C6T134_9ACTN|nr:aldose 1-epimerase [Micromonospora rhizosphaerae]SCL35369.1 Galactose mutarotase [Micromonospora rhizosphaerae]
MRRLDVVERRGWEIVRLGSDLLAAEVLPGKGGDVLSLQWLGTATELLWQSPWGLRARGAVTTSEHDVARLIEAYPGGWQTVFPNGGDAVTEHGVAWGMHGEAWLTPFDWTPVNGAGGGCGVELRARLVRSPFEIVKRVVLDADRLSVSETITNVGGEPIEAMWSQHPAFGAPLIGPDTLIEATAGTFVVDDRRDTPSGDLALGVRATWPHVPGRGGGTVDLTRIPAPDAGVDRMGYLTDFTRGHAAIRNPRLGLAVEVDWDAATLPHAWYWLEAGGGAGFPWYRSAYVLAIEPATSFPGQGIAAVRANTGTQVVFAPGETRTASVTVTVRELA